MRGAHGQLLRLFQGGAGNTGESLWEVCNSVTEFLEHARARYRCASDPIRDMPSQRFCSAQKTELLARVGGAPRGPQYSPPIRGACGGTRKSVIKTGGDDGLLQRFLVFYPDALPAFVKPRKSLAPDLAQTFRRLVGLRETLGPHHP
jgi:hypothetical protein